MHRSGLQGGGDCCDLVARRRDADVVTQILTDKPYTDPFVWTRFLTCAARIRYIGHVQCREYASPVLKALLDHNGGKTFLPMLRTLSWIQNRSSGLLLLSFAPPTLRNLFILGFSGQYEFVDAVTPHLASAFPNLRYLELNRTRSGAAPLLKSLRGLAQLDELNLTPTEQFGPQEWKLIGSTMTLRKLRVYIDGFAGPVPCSVPNLFALKCTGSVEQSLYLVQSLDAPRLEELELIPHGKISLEEFRKLLEGISAPDFAPSLRQLTLIRDDTGMEWRVTALSSTPHSDTFADMLRPCFELKKLEVLALHIVWKGMPVICDDDDILAIARALPQLRALDVNLVPTTPLTLQIFVLVAKLCPKLQSFGFHAFRAQPFKLKQPFTPPTPNHPLRIIKFRLAEGTLGNLGKAASYLHTLFPHLDIEAQRRHFEGDRSLVKGEWPGVWLRIKAMQDYKRLHSEAART